MKRTGYLMLMITMFGLMLAPVVPLTVQECWGA